MQTRKEAIQHLNKVLQKLDSMADEDQLAETFIVDALIVGNEIDGFTVDMGTLLYNLNELGEHKLALDLRNWHNAQTRL